MNPFDQANQLGMMARMAMEGRNYPDALRFLSMGIDMLSSFPSHYEVAVPFLLDRAECLWQLGSVSESLQNLHEATQIGLPRDFPLAENEACKWSNRGFGLCQEGDFSSAEKCCSSALRIPASRKTRAEIRFCRIIARGSGRSEEVLRDAEEIKKLDVNAARSFAQSRKEVAIENFRKQEFQRALNEFDLALTLHPEDASKVKFKRSIDSHKTAVHFKMKQYKEALELGQESHKSNTSYKSKDEAARWKERGNSLWKENSLDFAIAYYSLAINFAPPNEKDLRATILSNRSLVYKKQGKDEEALSDARECVKNKPGWSKGQYRLGASLFAQKKYNEAMQAFATSLQLMLKESGSSEHDQVDTLTQIISVATELSDGTSKVQYAIPMKVIQRVVDKVVSEKDWKKLYLLFLGGGGERNFKMGEGGLCIESCDASAVPLKEVIQSNFPNRDKFISVLRDHKAELPQEGILDEGLAAAGSGEDDRAINLLQLSLHSDEISLEKKRDVLKRLCSLYFKGGHFQKCLDAGRKLKAAFPDETSKISATQWKNWGNELNQERKFGLMADYYTLAIDFTPDLEHELLTALLSNRSLAYVNLKNYNKALEDARKCIHIRPQWFRGYRRLGNCFIEMERREEALKAFCDAYQHACSDKEKQATAKDVISTAMSMDGGESRIFCTFVPDVLKYLVKNAVENSDWAKLRFLYLGTSGRGGPANECDASQVPLELLIESDVDDLHRLVTVLLERGASPSGFKKAPLLTAMERTQFPLALTLLKSGADPAAVVGEDTFMTKEGQPREWLQIGHKALDRRDNKKALMFFSMAFHLCDASTGLTMMHHTLHALSEAHFRLNEHEKCIEAGNECFKLKSLKSEEEAKTWEGRANVAFDSEMYSTSIEYIKMALKYLPADKTRTFSLLLCKRCDAYEKSKDLSSALADAKSASRMDPYLLEGYLGQLKCLRGLQDHRGAMQAINECLRRTNDDSLVYRLLSDALEIAGHIDDGTSALTVAVPKEMVTKLVNDVIGVKDWLKLRSLYLGGGGPNSYPVGEGGLATESDASMVSLGQVLQSTVPDKLLLVSALLRHGASANPITELDPVPLEEALRQDHLPMVEKLIGNGANPCLTVDQGGTIIHKALRLGLKKGDFTFLEALMSSKHPEIENVQDSEGNTLYHLATAGKKPNQHKCRAIRLLRDANVNPNLPNKKGLCAVDTVNKSDSRWKMLSTAAEIYKPNTSSSPPSTITPGHDESSGWDEQDSSSASTEQDINVTPEGINAETEDEVSSTPLTSVKARKIDYKQQQREETRESISLLIENLSAELPMFSVNAKDGEDIKTFSDTQESVQPTDTFDEQSSEEIPSVPAEECERRASTDSESDDTANTGGVDFDSPFENLPWEVDCTDQVWKIMRSKRVGKVLRKRIVNKIRMLANGRWSRNLCKRLDGVAKNADILLYESKLTKSHRIVWEKTIAFSGRCSDDPEVRCNSKNSQGRIYSDIIRVWDIVLDHDTLPRAIDRIVKSHNRGMECIIKTNLKGIKKESSNNESYSAVCFPNKYAEISELSLPKIEAAEKRDLPPKEAQPRDKIFFPPASAHDQEYHILKFYSFSTALVDTILESDLTSKIDFPFKITELEHAIVNLRPKPPSPVILLGRSGTGKTTCCLYRLWNNFQKYWENATTAGPHLPRYKPPQKENEDGEEGTVVPKTVNEVVRKGRVEEVQLASVSEESASCGGSSYRLTSQPPLQQSDSKAGLCNESRSVEEMTEEEMFEHLHQVFITKNTVLCGEVEKNFKELCRACLSTRRRVQFEDKEIPARIQDVVDEAWPLFVSSRDWLLLLDASLPGKPFFRRAADGHLVRKIGGWGEDENHLRFIPLTESDEEDSDEESEDPTETQSGDREHNDEKVQNQNERDPRTEITYQVFKDAIWPKMRKSLKEKVDYHPTLVWTEIRSFIKGSAEALLGEGGVLALEEYKSLGKKKAPNFTADREIVYRLFEVYQRVRSSYRMFDEADLVYSLHERLQLAPYWSIHEFYVDETQDFTQAELSLLIRCCRFPNRLFFTGDTAQSIMKGIAFRFDDLKSLFYHVRKATGRAEEQQDLVTVPKTLYQLTHNYRSHAGILRLASSIVDLLVRFFPESFDKLEKDQGLFEGPKPVLFESCSLTDLAMILRGNRRQSSRIEFGAHQVVLVVSNEARDAMPDELKQGLVMTIYEAKGLEFDDVLIYNFFKDSQASKEWRVVTTFAEELQNGSKSVPVGLVELSEENVNSKPTRPLEFDCEKHKVLNSEFKNLYTAVTRARVNVWFFDEDLDARAPIFEYFRRLDLVRLVALETGNNNSNSLVSMFAVQSTPEEWRKGGMKFYKNRLWAAAIQCFTFAGDELMLQRSRAQQQAAEANKLRVTNRQQMLDEFLRAAQSFLKCNMHYEAEICLHNAREWILLARLYKKTGKFRKAAKLFKRKQLFMEASQCYESQNNYAEAIEILCQAGQFEKALDALERFNSLSISGSLEERHGIIPPKATRTVERLLFKLADQYFQNGNVQQMEEVIQRLPSAADRITFLKKRGCIVEAAKAMSDNGRRDDAARLLRETGRFKEAVKYSSDPRFAADCLLYSARTTTDGNDIPKILQQALEKYQQCGDVNGQAETLLLLGKTQQDAQKVKDAGRLFDKSKNCCGEVESVSELLDLTSSTPPADLKQWVIVRALERVLRLTSSLFKPAGKRKVAEQIEIEKCEEHFGLCKTDDAQQRTFFPRCGGRFAQVDPEVLHKESSERKIIIATIETHEKIRRFLVAFTARLITKICKMLEKSLERNLVCNKVTEGNLCDNVECKNPHQDSDRLFFGRFEALFNFVYLESVVEGFTNEMVVNKDGKEALKMLLFEDFREFRACQRFYDFLCPGSGFRHNQLTKKGNPLVDNTRMTKSVSNRLRQFAEVSWKSLDEEKRRSNTDNFLKVSFCLQLIGSGSLMATWISEEEKKFEKKAKRSQSRITITQLVKNGMVDDSRDGKNRYESYLHWWEDGKRRLYVYGDVENAAHLIVRRFLTLTARRGSITYPSIANTVMILEHQLTACLALYTRLCTEHRYPICLPASYLTMVRFWDNLWAAENGKYTLYQAVEYNVSRVQGKELQRSVQSILSHIVKLTCGNIAQFFDVLGDAVGSEESPKYCSSGEAERSLILVLTMLCNCAKAICHNCDEVLLTNIWRINPHSCLPARMSKVLEDIKVARGFRDVVITLTRFLKDRGEEFYDLRWNSGRLWYDGPSSPGSFPDKFHVDASQLREKLKEIHQRQNSDDGESATVKSQEDDLESADGPDISTETMAKEYMEDEFKEKEKTKLEVNAAVIQKWLRRMKVVRKLLFLANILRERRLKREESREEHSKNPKLGDEHRRFTQFGLDTSACGICGTKFEESVPFGNVDDTAEGSQNANREGIDEEYSQRKDHLERSFSVDDKSNTYEAHVKSLSHLQKKGEFDRYRDYFLTKIHPLLRQEEKWTESQDAGLTLDLERLERNRTTVTSKVQAIESSREWSNTTELERAVEEYQAVLQDLQKTVEEDRNIVNGSRSEDEEEEEADAINEEGDDDSSQIKDIHLEKKLGGKRRRHRKKNRARKH